MKEDWPKFAIVERHLGPLKNQMIDIESHLVNQDWYTIESDMPFVRAEVGDLDEIMGCFPHLQKEEEEADRMGWTVQNRRTLLTYLLERAKRGLVITATVG